MESLFGLLLGLATGAGGAVGGTLASVALLTRLQRRLQAEYALKLRDVQAEAGLCHKRIAAAQEQWRQAEELLATLNSKREHDADAIAQECRELCGELLDQRLKEYRAEAEEQLVTLAGSVSSLVDTVEKSHTTLKGEIDGIKAFVVQTAEAAQRQREQLQPTAATPSPASLDELQRRLSEQHALQREFLARRGINTQPGGGL